MEEEKTLTPLESMEVIVRAISRTKNDIKANSFYFLLWGWLIAFASFAFFVLSVFFDVFLHFIPFPILGTVGAIVSIIHYRRRRIVATESYVSHFLKCMWAVIGVSFLIVVFINVSRGQPPFTYTLLLAGIGTLVSGWVMKFKPLVFGGILFLVSCVASVYVASEYKALLQGIAVVAGYLVPGYLLKSAED